MWKGETMKRMTAFIVTALAAVLAVGVMAGCSSQQGGSTGETAAVQRLEGGQTQIAIEASESDVLPEGKYRFSYNGFEIVPGAKVDTALDAFGDDYDRMEVASCAYQGVDIVYTYPGFTLYAYTDAGVEYINVIEITNSLINCGGISVGDSIKKAKELYGEPTVGDDFGVLYHDGKTDLQISTDGVDTIVAIVYKRAE